MLHKSSASEYLFRKVACPVCSADHYAIVFPIDKVFASRVSGIDLSELPIGLAFCKECGHQFIQPMPQSAFLKAFYASYMSLAKDGFYQERGKENIPAPFRQHYGGWLKRIRALKEGGSLLDVGTGLGMFLRLAREHGFEVAGVEPNHEAAEMLQERYGIAIYNSLLEELDVPVQYDVATMWDLLEHLPEPRAAMRKVHEVLKPSGLLALEIPVRDSFIHWLVKGIYQASAGRVRRPLFRVYGVHHLQYFSEKSIQEFLSDNGFEVIELHRGETDVHALLKHPGRSDRIQVEAYNAVIQGVFLLGRLLKKQNKLMILARRADAKSA